MSHQRPKLPRLKVWPWGVRGPLIKGTQTPPLFLFTKPRMFFGKYMPESSWALLVHIEVFFAVNIR